MIRCRSLGATEKDRNVFFVWFWLILFKNDGEEWETRTVQTAQWAAVKTVQISMEATAQRAAVDTAQWVDETAVTAVLLEDLSDLVAKFRGCFQAGSLGN